jgi:hypothetical protein
MIDSEPGVNGTLRLFGHSEPCPTGNVPFVPTNRDTVLTDFVRMKITEWEKSGREQQELAEKAGFAKSTVSQVKKSTGVGAKTAPGFAKAFDFPNVDAMVDAAYEWRRSSGHALEALLAEEPVQRAMERTITWIVGTTQESLRAILAAYTHPRFRGRSYEFWEKTLGEEAMRDADAVRLATASRTEAKRKKSRAAQTNRRAWVESSAIKKRSADDATPPKASDVVESPRRGKRAG